MNSGCLSKIEIETVFELACKLTGCSKTFRPEIIIQRIEQRIEELGLANLGDYLTLSMQESEEYENLISLLTINTTSWFRENEQLETFVRLLSAKEEFAGRTVRILSAACSTGEEVYTVAALCESAVYAGEIKDWKIVGWDLDKHALGVAKRGIYDGQVVRSQVPKRYHKFFRFELFQNRAKAVISRRMADRVRFHSMNLMEIDRVEVPDVDEAFDFAFCRNVLIYFSQEDVQRTARGLLGFLSPTGFLITGGSESLEHDGIGLKRVDSSVYTPKGRGTAASPDGSRVTEVNHLKKRPREVVVIDDELEMSEILASEILDFGYTSRCFPIPTEAEDYLLKHGSRVIGIISDLMMPRLSGIQLINRLRRAGLETPAIMLTGHATSRHRSDALRSGFVDVLSKPFSRNDVALALKTFEHEWDYAHGVGGNLRAGQRLILIGASTGGPHVLDEILCRLPVDAPPIVVVQHMDPRFHAQFAARIAVNSELVLGRFKSSVPLERGHIYVPGLGRHAYIANEVGGLALHSVEGEPVNEHVPSIDVCFESAAQLEGVRICAMLLTGMGEDGARGLLSLREKGALTLAQDEESSTVFGMPQVAIKKGAAKFVCSPRELHEILMKFCASHGEVGDALYLRERVRGV